jgi:hypothetical protein
MISWHRLPVSAADRRRFFPRRYVVAGRSLNGTEQAESALGLWAVFGSAAAVLLAGGLSLIVQRQVDVRGLSYGAARTGRVCCIA